MFRKCLAALLAVSLVLLCFGCGGKGTNDPGETQTGIADGDKIALIVGDAEQEPELAAAADALVAQYGDALTVLHYPTNFATDDTALTDTADKAVQEESVKAVIFANGVNGTAKAAAHVRQIRPETAIIVCNPLEGIDSVRLTANLIFSLDFAAFADALVQNVKTMGAKTLVFYTTDRDLKLPVIRDLRAAVESGCKTQKLTCKVVSSVDVYAKDRSAEKAKQYIAEDVPRRSETLGAKTALFCTEPLVQGALAKAAAGQKLYMPAVFLPSPIALTGSLDVQTDGHATDSAFALQALQDAAAKNGTHGRVSTWRFSEPVVSLLAAMDYACAVTRGDAGLMVDAGAVDGYARAHTDAEFSFADSVYNNVYLFRSALVTL